jgi:hypothetical protein
VLALLQPTTAINQATALIGTMFPAIKALGITSL